MCNDVSCREFASLSIERDELRRRVDFLLKQVDRKNYIANIVSYNYNLLKLSQIAEKDNDQESARLYLNRLKGSPDLPARIYGALMKMVKIDLQLEELVTRVTWECLEEYTAPNAKMLLFDNKEKAPKKYRLIKQA